MNKQLQYYSNPPVEINERFFLQIKIFSFYKDKKYNYGLIFKWEFYPIDPHVKFTL